MSTATRWLSAVAALAMLATATLTAVATPAEAMAAGSDTPVSAAAFPDPVLRAYVGAHADTNHDGTLSAAEKNAFTEIKLRKKPDDPDATKVHDAKGIAYFPNLTNLDLYSNDLSSIDLSHNPKLMAVDLCNSHDLKSVDLSHNPDLWFFAANMAGLTSIDVSHNPKLESLQVAGNHITSLDLTPYPNIKRSWVQYNPLVALKAGTGITFTNDGNQTGAPVQGWDPYDRGYALDYPKSGSIDMRTIAPWFDASKVSDLKGAKLSGTTFTDLTGTVTYTYAIGNGQTLQSRIDVSNVPIVVTYDGNGATSGSMAPTTHSSQFDFGTVPASSYTRDGYTFKDWNTARDGSGQTYRPGEIASFGASTTLYAQWTRNAAQPDKPSQPTTPSKPSKPSKPSQPTTPDKPSDSTPRFVDVTDATPHADDIRWLASSGISTGWKRADGTREFRGMTAVTRQDMAAFLYRLAGSPKFDETKARNPFIDVTAKTPHYKEILWLTSTGISTGWVNPTTHTATFRGMDSVKRQDMAAFLERLALWDKATPKLGASLHFADVTAATPHAASIDWLARTGVTTGWTDKATGTRTFRGMQSVVRQDMAAFLQRMDANVLK